MIFLSFSLLSFSLLFQLTSGGGGVLDSPNRAINYSNARPDLSPPGDGPLQGV